MKFKNLFWAIITILTLVLATFPLISKAVSTTISVSPATNVYDPPQSFTIDIDISDVTDLASWELKLRFDNQILNTNSTSIVEGGFLKSAGATDFYGEVSPSKDYVIVGCFLNVAGGASGSGTLASVTFTVLDTGSCSLHLYDSSLYDSALSEIVHTTSDSDFSTSYFRPVAAFSYSPSSPVEIGGPVTFDASDSYDTDGNIAEYEWNFGDGNTTTTSNPEIIHNYTDLGTFIVTLTVYDDDSPPNHAVVTDSVRILFPGDANDDRKVNWKDLRVLALAYGTEMGDEKYALGADFNVDGKINWKDLRILALNYGKEC